MNDSTIFILPPNSHPLSPTSQYAVDVRPPAGPPKLSSGYLIAGEWIGLSTFSCGGTPPSMSPPPMVGLGPVLVVLRLLRKKNTSAPKIIKPPTTPPAIPPIAPEERPDDELVEDGAAGPLVVLDELEVGEGLDEDVVAVVVGG